MLALLPIFGGLAIQENIKKGKGAMVMFYYCGIKMLGSIWVISAWRNFLLKNFDFVTSLLKIHPPFF